MPGPTLSRRVMSLKPSATLAVGGRAKALIRQGADVVNFSLGEPDFPTPEPIRRAAERALEAGQTHYMPTLGDPETRGVIAEKLARENGIPGVAAEHVAISVGAKQSLYVACQCLLDEATERRSDGATKGEGANEVLLPVPSWVSYAPIAELAGGRIVPLPTTMENGFRVTAEQLRRAITPRSRILLLNSPSNPCGTMYGEAELRALAGVVAEAAGGGAGMAPELVIITDEIYEKIVYGGAGGVRPFSIGSVPEVAERTITVNGMSKAYAMTGWRIGYAACPGEFGLRLMKAFDTLQGQMTNNITSFTYPAIRAALTECAEDVERMRRAFESRAELIYGLAERVPGMRAARPQGAFYLFPDVSACFGKKSEGGRAVGSALEFAEALLNEKHVAVVPGEDFGGVGGKHVRFSFACSERDIERGMGRVREFVEGMR